MNPLFRAYDATDHAARMVVGARAAEERGDLADALADLAIAEAANQKATRAIADAIAELKARVSRATTEPRRAGS